MYTLQGIVEKLKQVKPEKLEGTFESVIQIVLQKVFS